jgi:hypothetical protein
MQAELLITKETLSAAFLHSQPSLILAEEKPATPQGRGNNAFRQKGVCNLT